MGMAGTTYPYFVSYVEPASTFNLSYAVNSIAMPLIGGMTTWVGPLIGALLLGTVQQVVQVTISSAWNLLIVGVLLVLFVTLAPEGIMGLWYDFRKKQRMKKEKGGAQ
jgi:branched-chain amino acid transport system permease protein